MHRSGGSNVRYVSSGGKSYQHSSHTRRKTPEDHRFTWNNWTVCRTRIYWEGVPANEMKPVRVAIGGLTALCVGLIALPLLYAFPIAGVGSLPMVSDDRAFDLVMLTPVLLPIAIISAVGLISFEYVIRGSSDRGESVASGVADRSTGVRTEGDESEWTASQSDPLEVLKESYATDEITHEEYERRLQVLLDVDSSDELQQRLEEVTNDDRTR